MFLNVIERVSWRTLASMVWDIRAHRKQQAAGMTVKKIDARCMQPTASTNFYFHWLRKNACRLVDHDCELSSGQRQAQRGVVAANAVTKILALSIQVEAWF
ncbi:MULTISPECIES: hypothetical protein [unclassified Rhizobium]|uniref:hypothetical protein n=1 Tax=unclassified Rhizobium TaxID=2613769 RepID=UPI0007EADC02|nr:MULTISPECIES: hypothetical protein [unclassified Rhizobium]